MKIVVRAALVLAIAFVYGLVGGAVELSLAKWLSTFVVRSSPWFGAIQSSGTLTVVPAAVFVPLLFAFVYVRVRLRLGLAAMLVALLASMLLLFFGAWSFEGLAEARRIVVAEFPLLSALLVLGAWIVTCEIRYRASIEISDLHRR